MYRVLFVCSSNVCRSPYCEYEFRRIIEADPVLSGMVEVQSSAVLNQMKKMDPKTRAALLKDGFSEAECDAHRPGVFYRDAKKFREADIIIGMTRMQKLTLLLMPGGWAKKYTTLSEAAGHPYKSVPDPWLEKDMEKYFAVMDELKGYVTEYAERLKEQLTKEI